MNLHEPVSHLNRVGKTVATRLKKLGIETVSDLVAHIPFRYEDWSRVVAIAQLRPDEPATIRGKITLIQTRRSPRKRTFLTEALVTDSSGSLKAVWFNQPYLSKTIKIGDELFLAGRYARSREGWQLVAPEWERASALGTTHTARLVPVYPATEGITQKQIRFLLKSVQSALEEVLDWVPEEVCARAGMMPVTQALMLVHFPKTVDEADRGIKRLKFNELFRLQLMAERSRRALGEQHAAVFLFQQKKTADFVSSLPFKLTASQKKAAWEIFQDMEKETPMNRLLEGDVGSGKTAVAALAALGAFWNGYQTALLAPTEILAAQHFETFKALLVGTGCEPLLFTRSMKRNVQEELKKKDALALIEKGKAHLVIGTHALVQEGVSFHNLGLAIVDEQHRFGVGQRKALRAKAGHPLSPHFLSLTATPIPRTLALTVYGDLHISLLKEKPAGRKIILTKLVDAHQREKAYAFVREQIKKGRQAFVICPLVDPSDKLGAKSVKVEHKKLQEHIFPDLAIGMVHGKLKAREKEDVMRAFLNNETKILVATSVIEVGVNVPNANIMIIEDAERFGLAQLHQFRGRVGRSEHQSYCLLFSETMGGQAEERLALFQKCHDGFELAEKDMELRGPGEIYGVEQSGFGGLKIASLHDVEIIKTARDAATFVLDGGLEKFPVLSEKIKEWEENIHWE